MNTYTEAEKAKQNFMNAVYDFLRIPLFIEWLSKFKIFQKRKQSLAEELASMTPFTVYEVQSIVDAIKVRKDFKLDSKEAEGTWIIKTCSYAVLEYAIERAISLQEAFVSCPWDAITVNNTNYIYKRF